MANFVLFEPSLIPLGLVVSEASSRLEAPPRKVEPTGLPARGSSASHRMVLAAEGRSLSIKQFLYDWAPPAYDHPSLWNTTRDPVPFLVGEQVGWLGVNYRGQTAASLTMDRTTIEVTALQGAVDDAAFVDLCGGLTAVDCDSRAQILETPFHELTYQRRHAVKSARVPTGFWAHQRRPSFRQTVTGPTRTPLGPAAYERLARALAPDYAPASVFTFHTAAGTLCEADYLFEHRLIRGASVHLLVADPRDSRRVHWPPQADTQKAVREQVRVGATEIYYAFLDPAVGPHEVVWREGDVICILLVKPVAIASRSWFLTLLSKIVPASTSSAVGT